MNRQAENHRPPSRRRRRVAAGALLFTCCLGAVPASSADGLVEECLLAGRVARIGADSAGKQVHVEFREARSTAAAPCRMGPPDTPRRIQFHVTQDLRLASSVPGAKVRYRYRRFADGETSWEAVAVTPRSQR